MTLAAGRLLVFFVCLLVLLLCVLFVSCFASVMGFSQSSALISPRLGYAVKIK